MDFPKDQRGRGAAASRKGRINVEHGAARRPTIPKIMAQGTDYFKLTIQNYLDARAREDELFAPRYANPKRTLTIAALSSSTKYGRAVATGLPTRNILYGTPLLRRGGHRHRQPVSCKVVVNHTVELTEEEKPRHGGTPYGRPRAKPTPSWRKPSPNPRKSKITN